MVMKTSSEKKEEEREEEIEKMKEIPEWMEDGLELKYIFDAISGFLKEIKDPLKDLLDAVLSPLDGDKLGKDLGSLYRNLKESDVPEDLASEIIKKYFETKLSVFKIFEKLQNVVGIEKTPSPETLTKLTELAKTAKEIKEAREGKEKEEK